MPSGRREATLPPTVLLAWLYSDTSFCSVYRQKIVTKNEEICERPSERSTSVTRRERDLGRLEEGRDKRGEP